MARPFGQNDDSDGQQKEDIQRKSIKLSLKHKEKSIESSSEYLANNKTSDQSATAVTNVYCISNSNLLNCGPTFINVINGIQNTKKAHTHSSSFNKSKSETERRIRIKKGIFTSSRIIDVGDIQIVTEVIKDDWKNLLKKLPGVTLDNLCFHQAVINAMDRGDSTNMAEIVLRIWKKELPEFSTIGNLSKTLFSIGHPDIVTYLKP